MLYLGFVMHFGSILPTEILPNKKYIDRFNGNDVLITSAIQDCDLYAFFPTTIRSKSKISNYYSYFFL